MAHPISDTLCSMDVDRSDRVLKLIAFSVGSGLVYGMSAAGVVFFDRLTLTIGGIAGVLLGILTCFFVLPFLMHTKLQHSLPAVFICTLATAIATAPFLYVLSGLAALIMEFAACAAAYRLFHVPPTPYACPRCGYDLRGLRTTVCPECAYDVLPPDQTSD